jgi:hypothetical protein
MKRAVEEDFPIAQKYPRLQLRTVKELMEGKGIERPSEAEAVDRTLKKAPESKKKQGQQKDKTGRPNIDAFETAMRRAKCEKGFFVSFDYSSDALREIDRFFREEHRVIIPITGRDILDEEIARKLA